MMEVAQRALVGVRDDAAVVGSGVLWVSTNTADDGQLYPAADAGRVPLSSNLAVFERRATSGAAIARINAER
jgi:hypothetical protein